MSSANSIQDTVSISIAFENGSIASISYFSNGSKKLAKEYLEVFCGEQSIIIDDFKTATIYGKSKYKTKLAQQEKGHQQEITAFIEAVKQGTSLPISFEECYESTKATFEVVEQL